MTQNRSTEFYSLITGASSGIGKVIAYECAKRSMNLVLVALDDNILDETTLELSNEFPSLKIIALPVDLADNMAAHIIFNYCQKHSVTINMLINNAAIGGSGKFLSHSASFHENALKINAMTPLLLTRLFIPEMLKLNTAYILNVSSAASFFDMPYKIIYASTKSFVYSFTRALREELLNTGITVSVLCSGGVVTNAETKKRCEELGYISKKLQLSAEAVAIEAVKGLLKGKRLILPGLSSKLFFILSKILPYRLKILVLTKYYKRVYDRPKVNTSVLLQEPVIVNSN